MPDLLHIAMAKTLGDYHWRAFCDAWLAIGLAATAARYRADAAWARGHEPVVTDAAARAELALKIGRVVRRRLK